MKPRVAVVAKNLSAHAPRGVTRVARAITEELVARDDFDLYAISAPYYALGNVLVDRIDLGGFLRSMPMSRPSLEVDVVIPHNVESSSESSHHDSLRRRVAKRFAFLTAPGWTHLGYRWSKILGVEWVTRPMYRSLKRAIGARPSVHSHDPVVRRIDLSGQLDRNIDPEPIGINYFDAVLSFEAFEDFWDWPAETFRCACIGYFHDAVPMRLYEGPEGRPDHFFRAVSKMVLRADHIVCVSHASLADLIDIFPASNGKSSVVYNGHDHGRFERVASRTRRCRPGQINILMVGDIDRRKNLQCVLRALPLLHQLLPDVKTRLTIVGNPSARNHFSDLEAIAAKHATVTWAGYLGDGKLADLYCESDVFVFPSLLEGFGIPILEAMTARVPVVTSCLSAMAEVAGGYAFTCDPFDPSSLALAIQKAHSLSPEERCIFLDNAARWANNYTWKRSVDRLTAVIRSAVNNSQPITASAV